MTNSLFLPYDDIFVFSPRRIMKLRTFLFILLIFGPVCGLARPVPFEPFAGKYSKERFVPKHTPEEYFNQGQLYLKFRHYRQALLCFGIITHHFPESSLYDEALYYIGKCRFHLGQHELADRDLSQYLQSEKVQHIEDIFSMKHSMAQSYAKGKRKKIVPLEGFPNLLKADEEALRLYDEVLTAFPRQDLGVQALYNKGLFLMSKKDFAEAIKVFKKLTLQFPTHTLSPQAFVRLSEIYFHQAQNELHNDHYLYLATQNKEAMAKQHPNHPLNAKVLANLQATGDSYAWGLYATGRFYEKKRKKHAAKIYYSTAVKNFPESSLADKCQQRLDRIAKSLA